MYTAYKPMHFYALFDFFVIQQQRKDGFPMAGLSQNCSFC